jgi:endoribonuclease Dicer
MREYYQIPQPLRPKIFGMTASPIWNPKDPEGSLGTLEKNLDSIAISVKDHIAELRDNSPRPVEVSCFNTWFPYLFSMSSKMIKQFPEPPSDYIYLKVPLRECLYMYIASQEFDIPWDKICQRYIVTLLSIGPYGADLFLYMDFKQRIHNIINQSHPPDSFIHEIKRLDMDIEDPLTPLPPHVTEIESILSEYGPFFADQSGDVPVPVPLHWCTPKVKVLVDILRESAESSFQGIIFVEQRQVASCLAKILPQIPELQGLIRCAELVGHGGANSGNMQARGMGLARQQDVVQSFRDKQINLCEFHGFVPVIVLIDNLDSGSHVCSRGRS